MNIKLYSFLFLFIIFLIIICYMNTKSLKNCGCDCKKEGMISGSMKGYVKRQIHPIARKVRNNFTSSSKMTDYYVNKLDQIFR